MAAKTFIGIPTLVRIVARIFVLFHLLHINNKLSYHTLLGYFLLTSPSSSDDPSDTVRVSRVRGFGITWCEKPFRKTLNQLVFKTKEEALQNRPEEVKPEAWPILCEHFSSPEYIGPLMMVDEIFDTILPPRLGYIAEQRLKVPEERAKTIEGMNEELLKQVAELKVCQDQMEASLYERLWADIRHHYEDQGWSTSNSLPSFIHNNINRE
ncbi:hypothetical protein FNV43_RR00692 [Rhamnella rubrinervis]|uniref:Uncharacterized protein n=1 Tax=Rhamnella rubrinervis TaxID=2594499 RepID=A0A8K0MS70_9ROSA|nr:hypothetical protein FNV43_RR00692 [Rhamnella rubrinervis]